MRPGVRYRLTSRSNDELAAGHWELYLHELLIRLGYDVAFEPALSTDRRVDFFVSRGGASFYLEATVAHSSRDERSADAHRNRIYRELQRVRTDQSMFGIEIQRAGPRDMPHAGICRQRVEEWLRGLDPDAVTIAREVALLAQLGVDPRDALATATVVPREFLGDGREVADIVTYDDDPRDDPELLNRPAAVVVGSTRLK